MNENDVTIITGASRGIGRGVAVRFASEKNKIMLFGRDADALRATRNELKPYGIENEIFTGDVSDADFVNKCVNKIIDKFGRVDHLINNAGTRIFKKVTDATLGEFKKQIDANLYGIFNLTKACLPFMIERKSGSIINIVSLAGKNSFVTGSMYSASKYAALGFTRSLMLEVREYNIRVAAVCPGSVDTQFFDGTDMKPNRDKILKVEDIAETVLAILKLPPHALISEIDIRPTNPR